MKNKYLISVLFLIILNVHSQNIAEHYKADLFEAAIFPKTSDGFTPNKNEILKAEKCLQSKFKNLNVELENIEKYKRQYFGLYDENGNVYLLINFFIPNKILEETWLDKKIIVKDGGSNYWNIKYYIDTDELKELNVNGNS
jgi:hypothetical protein